MSDLRAFLQRLALDDTFRDLLRDDPEAAFSGYTLSEAHQAALRRRDDDWLALIGEAVRAGAAPAPPAEPVPVPAGPDLPEARVLLRMRPQMMADRWVWAASLHAWPAPPGEPGTAGFLVRIVPRATSLEGGALQVSYAASIQPAPLGDEPEPEGPTPTEGSPWGHRTDTDAARAAAEAVLEGTAEERYDRLLALLQAVTGGAA